MNNARRKAIKAALELADAAKSQLEQAKGDLESLRDEEQDYYDNMPENMQGGEKGERAQAAIDTLEEIIGNLETAHDEIDNAVSAGENIDG